MGTGKGWNKFNFILTPTEFELIFRDLSFSFVITGARVEIDYQQTYQNIIFDAYKLFFEQVLIGKNTLEKTERWNYEKNIRISIIDDINKIKFKDIINDNREISQEFKLVNPIEPVINISPFYLYFLKNPEKLSIAYLNDEGVIGLQFSYPKFISWETKNFNKIHTTEEFKANMLLNNLIKNIKQISHKAKVISISKVHKPNLWISNEASLLINKNKYLISNELTIQ